MKSETDMTPDEIEKKPVRKKPAVRASATPVETAPVKAPRKRAAAAVIPVVEAETPAKKGNTKLVLLMAIAFLAGSLTTYVVTGNSTPKTVAPVSTFTDVIAGKVALSESELIDAVKKLGVTVYWAGPVKDAKYTLAVPADGQAYVRYLPNGQGIDDTAPNYVVIATYTTTNAFTATQSAGNQSNGVSFINAEGAAVYYSKDTPTNVYVAYPNLNYQIEIFDPIAATALDIASKNGALKVIK
jgi:hypothetical protein